MRNFCTEMVNPLTNALFVYFECEAIRVNQKFSPFFNLKLKWHFIKNELTLSFKIKTIWIYSLKPSICKLHNSTSIPFLVLRGKKLAAPVFDLVQIIEAASAQNVCHCVEKVVVGLYAGCERSSIASRFLIFSLVCLAVCGLTLSCCKRTFFWLTNAGYLRLNSAYIPSN